MERYDLHIHTHYSKCSNLSPEAILKTAKKLNLDGIAITDHDIFKGARLVSKLNKDKTLEVIKGMELTTNKAHLIALYIQEEIKTRDFFEALDQIKQQDGLAIIAHPYSPVRGHLKVKAKKIKNKINLETYNGRSFGYEDRRAKRLAKRYNIPQTAGSDAHFSFEIGRGITLFKDDLRKALKKRKTIIDGIPTTNLIGPGLSLLNKLFRPK